MAEGGDWDETGPRGEDVGDRPCTSGSRWAGGRSGWGARWGLGRGRASEEDGDCARERVKGVCCEHGTSGGGPPATCSLWSRAASGKRARATRARSCPVGMRGRGVIGGRAFVAPPPEQCRGASIAVRNCRLRLGGRRVSTGTVRPAVCPGRVPVEERPCSRGPSRAAQGTQRRRAAITRVTPSSPTRIFYSSADAFLSRTLPASPRIFNIPRPSLAH